MESTDSEKRNDEAAVQENEAAQQQMEEESAKAQKQKEKEKQKTAEQEAPSDTSENIPEYARLVLVPVANPETIPDMIHLAFALAHPEDGKVIALSVSLGDVEQEATTIDEVKEIIDSIYQENQRVTIESITATSVARGILDATREFGVDLVILGLQQPRRGEVMLGKVVETVTQTAACDVIIYRHVARKEPFDRVVVPVNGTFQSQVSARVGLLIGRTYETTVEAMHVQPSDASQYQGLARIEESIEQLPEHRRIRRTVVTAQDPAQGILSRTSRTDLVVLGFRPRTDLERVIYGDTGRTLMNRAEGPVIMVYRSMMRDSTAIRLRRRFLNWVRPTLTHVEQDEIIRQAQLDASLTLDFTVSMIISALIATFGLLLNSPAVIIGAMLVAPLISPLISLSSGLAIGRVKMASRALLTIAIGVLFGVGFSALIGWLLPTDNPTTEMLNRSRPTLLDAGVALASGVIGAYATARKGIPAALAGVAIAAALVPPICTIGLGFAFGDSGLGFGATVLFLTNIFAIVAGAMGTFLYLGMNLRRYDDVRQLWQNLALVLFVLCALPVGAEVVELTQQVGQENTVREDISGALAPAELVEMEVRYGDPTRIIATMRTVEQITFEDVVQLEERLSTSMGETVQLDLVLLPMVRFAVEPDEDTINIEAEVMPFIEGLLAPSSEATPEATPDISAEATAEATPD